MTRTSARSPTPAAGGSADARFSRRENRDARKWAEFLVPLDGHGDQVAVAVAGGDVGEHDLGQGAGLVQALARALDRAFQLQLLEDFLQHNLVVAANAEGAGDLALADLVGQGGASLRRRLAFAGDEGEDVLAARHRGFFGGGFFRHSCNIRIRLPRVIRELPRQREIAPEGPFDSLAKRRKTSLHSAACPRLNNRRKYPRDADNA